MCSSDRWRGSVSFGEVDGFTAGNTAGSSYDVGYPVRDKAGRIVQRVETTDGATQTTTYGYDSANRLETVAVDGVEVARYGYDTAGNVVSESTPGGVVASAYDAQDRVTARGAVSYGFDADRQRTSAASGAAVTTYGWSTGRLASVTPPGGPVVGYGYDAFVRRAAGGAVGERHPGARLPVVGVAAGRGG